MKKSLLRILVLSACLLWFSIPHLLLAETPLCGPSDLRIKSIWPALIELDPLTLKIKEKNSYWIIDKSNASPYGNYAWGLSGQGPAENPSIYYLHTIYNFDGTTSLYNFDMETGHSTLVVDLSALGMRAYGIAQNGDDFYVSYGTTVQRVGGGSLTLPENIGGLDYVPSEAGNFLLAIASAFYSHNVYKILLDENGEPTGTPVVATTIQAGLDSPLYPYKYTGISYARIDWEGLDEKEVLYVTKDDGTYEPWDVAAIVDFLTGDVLFDIDSRNSGIIVDPPITWPNGVTSDYLSWANPQGIEYIDGRLFMVSRFYWNKGPFIPPCLPSIDVEKYVSVDGQATWLDADSSPGPEVPVGAPVYFKVVVSNNGTSELTDLTLGDTHFSLEGCSLPDRLPPGDQFDCVIGPFQAIAGQHTNLATATAHFEGTTVSNSDPANYKGYEAVTILIAFMTATGLWEEQIDSDWNIEKGVAPLELEILSGESGSITYTLTATRTTPWVTDRYRVAGQICITNTGSETTQNLKITDQVQYRIESGAYSDLPGASQTIVPLEQLSPGETQCYSYDVELIPLLAADYRNLATVTITNYSGHHGQEFGLEIISDFSLPVAPTSSTEVDLIADVDDHFSCPDGFTCISTGGGPYRFVESGQIQYSMTIQNNSLPCNISSSLENTARLTEKDTAQQRLASATVLLSTGTCPGINCTRTIGYWKNHSKKIKPLLPVWLGRVGGAKSICVSTMSQALDVLEKRRYGTSTNGITKLYAQLLAAKLNIQNGAEGSTISSTISEADDFLSQHDWKGWGSISSTQRQMVLAWKTVLDQYNNGMIGPGHCP